MRLIKNIYIDILFVILIIILLSVSYVSFTRIDNLVKTSNLVNHNRLIEFKLEQTKLYLTDAETAQREFLLTKDTAFLNQYFNEFEKIPTLIAQLDSLTFNNEQEKKNLLSIKNITKNKFLLENLLNSSVSDKSIQIVPLLYQNKKIEDSIRAQIRHMEMADESLLSNEIKERNYFVFITPLMSRIVIFITLFIAILSYLKIRKDRLRLSFLNKQLKEKNLELEQRNMELSSFNYVASHDLQEPLRKIQLFSKRILDLDAEHLSKNGIDFFDRIKSSSERMQNLIRSLLNFSQSTISEATFEETDLNETLKEVELKLKDLITLKRAKIESEHLPTLNAVSAQMHQLFLHLIGNALKFSKPGTTPYLKLTAKKVPADEVSGRVKHNDNFWKIEIQDNGIGFEQIYQHKIFELFQRLNGTTDYEGMGIGLAICKKIVQTHNGTISATGRPGIGATFTLFLPENNK